MKSIPVILDTNCLVSALIFARGRMTWLRIAWQSGQIIPIVCKETVDELLRVFAYPKFHLERNEIDIMLAEFLPWTKVVVIDEEVDNIEKLRDKDDAVFIRLSQQTGAAYLVSGDRHILELKELFFELNIVSPSEFHEEIITYLQ